MKRSVSEGELAPPPMPIIKKTFKNYESANGIYIYSGLSTEWNRLEIYLNISEKFSWRKR